MLYILLNWLITSLAFCLTTYFLSGIHSDSILTILIAAAVFGIINAGIRPLILLITLPINILSFGVFTFFINGFMLWLTSKIVTDFQVDSFWWGFWGAIMISIFSAIIGVFFPKKDENNSNGNGGFRIHVNRGNSNQKRTVENADFEVVE